MRSVTSYKDLTLPELIEELGNVTSTLSAAYEDLAVSTAAYHREYLMEYARAAESSVAGKNRVAQHALLDMGSEILEKRGIIDSLTLCRDLLVFNLIGRQPGKVPFKDVASEDNGVPVV